MDRVTRWNALLELLTERGRLSIEEAAEHAGVSAATIRRDFDQLADQQMLTRSRGGAVANGVGELPLRYKWSRHASEKQRIGRAAANLVPPGAVVGLNGGTTTTEVARALAARPGAPTGATVTVVTNALNIANELAVRPQVKIVVTGGVTRPQSYELIGPLADASLRELSLDVAVIGVDGIGLDGVYAHDEGEASINRLTVRQARTVIVAADSSKLGERAFARICPLDAVDVLVTDAGADDAVVTAFEAVGVSVFRA
jgi:DeoR family transcriptional regulator of aga operon